MADRIRLDGKVAVVTGAAGVIGTATLRLLAERGARIVAVDRRETDLKDAIKDLPASAEALALTADVTEEDEVAGYVRAAVERFGTIDVFYNNAGIEGEVKPITEYSLAAFRKVLDVNVVGVFLGMKHVLPVMLKQNRGSIINTASIAGLMGSPQIAVYSASKHAVIGLTKSAAWECTGKGVRINCVCPGLIDSRMLSAIIRAHAGQRADAQRQTRRPDSGAASSDRRPRSPPSSHSSPPMKRAMSPAPPTPWTAAAPLPDVQSSLEGISLMPAILDPDAAAVYKAFQEAGRPPYENGTPAEARELYLKGRVSNPEPPELESVRPLSIPAPHGAIPARVYTPKTVRKTAGGAPCLVFYHGGGWVIGDLDSHDVVCRQLAHEGELIVISVDYRLAPEHKFPAAVDDAIAATKWVAGNAAQLGVDASRLTVGGDSAGGNLAAVVSIAARDGNGPAIAGQVLIYPGHRFHHGASLAQRAGNQHSSDAFRDPLVPRSLSQRRRRHQRLARLARARHDADRLAAGLRADRRRRSLARRRRRIRPPPQGSRRAGHLQALSRPIPRLLHHGQIAAAGQCRRERHRRLAEGAELTRPRRAAERLRRLTEGADEGAAHPLRIAESGQFRDALDRFAGGLHALSRHLDP